MTSCLLIILCKMLRYACLRNFTVDILYRQLLPVRLSYQVYVFMCRAVTCSYIWGSGYKGINPESRMTSGNYSSAMISGYQRGGFPLTSTISAGFDINF